MTRNGMAAQNNVC